jgi:type II secretory pathway component GspD/PulD (secretin)
MVSHNAPEVHILIEDERNIVIPTYYGNTSTDGTSSTGNAEKITAKTSLEIKKPKIGLPLIDENGTIISKGSIFMEVEVKAEKFDETQSNTYQGQSLPAKKIREAKSFVTIRNEEIIVLGGLQEVQVDSTESKYNLLSDIPYLGEKFFRPKTIKYTPTELLIFLKPTIMNAGTDNTQRNIQSIDDRIDADYAPKFRSPSGRILGMPNLDGTQNNTSSDQDTPAEKPSF